MSKLDPQLKNLLKDAEQPSTAPTRSRQQLSLHRSVDGAPPKIRVLLKCTGAIDAILALGFEVATRSGDIVAGVVGIDKVDALAALPSVVMIELARPLFSELNTSLPEIQGAAVHQAPSGLKGSGVIVGIIDTGIDYRHPCFLGADNKSRILFIWDQYLVPKADEKSPSEFSFGVEYTKAQIDAALGAPNPLALVRHEDTEGHGTHVTGIAAGNGSTSGNCRAAHTFVGVAPEADLIIVKDAGEEGELNDSFNLMTAVDYIFKKAAACGKPAVINMSQGDNLGPHDGTGLGEEFIDGLLDTPGRALVKSAGNEGAANRHVNAKVKAGATVHVGFCVPEGQREPIVFDLWYGGSDRFSFTLTPPGGTPSQAVNPQEAPTLALSNRNEALVYSSLDYSLNHDNQINWELRKGALATIQAGRWHFSLTGTTVADGDFHCWIQRDNATHFLTEDSSPGAILADVRCTISSPGSAVRVITVGAYSTKGESDGALGEFSSRGPTRDGRLKPEIAAPGEAITSARSQSLPSETLSLCSVCCQDQYYDARGTSMAAPHVTGVIALMLQKNRNLTPEQIRQHLFASARTSAKAGPLPNNEWGHGKVSALAAVNAVTPAPFSPLQPTTPPLPSSAVPQPLPVVGPDLLGDAPHTAFEHLRRAYTEILGTATGQEYVALVRTHLQEVRTLITTSRRVAAVWQRLGGAALLPQALEALREPDRPLPIASGEPPLTVRLRRFLAVLRRYGSAALIVDIDRYQAALAGLDGLTYNQLLTRLRAAG